MAQRRMFSKSITNSSEFLMLPPTSQLLYYHLGMNADDDGFCEHFTVMRMTESKPDDLRILQTRNFVHVFDDKVLIIKNWRENNYIQTDRYNPSKYLELYHKELKILAKNQKEMYTRCIRPCIQNASKTDTQVRLGKVRLGKDNKNIIAIEKPIAANAASKKKKYSEEFEIFWALRIPRDSGDDPKAQAFREYKNCRDAKVSHDDLVKAIKNKKIECELRGKIGTQWVPKTYTFLKTGSYANYINKTLEEIKRDASTAANNSSSNNIYDTYDRNMSAYFGTDKSNIGANDDKSPA